MADSNVRDAGKDVSFLVPDIGRYWIAYDFDSDGAAKTAWERIQAEVSFVSAWRTRAPAQPPHTQFQVWVLAERLSAVEAAETICRALGGSWWEPKDDMINALRERRQIQAIQAALDPIAGNAKYTNRFGDKGARLDRHGNMEPQ